MFLRVITHRVRREWLVSAVCLAFFGGVLFALERAIPDARILWALVPLAVFSLRGHNLASMILLSILCFSLGWWRGGVYVTRLATNEYFYGQKITVVGQANDDAVYGKRYQLEFSLRDVHVVAPVSKTFTGSLSIAGFGESTIYRGDTVRVTGKLYRTLGNNPGGISFAELTVVKRDKSSLNQFRRSFAAGMQTALPEPEASFALGLLVGQRTTLPDDTNEQLRRVGLTHIVAVSGANLTIIVLACRRLFSKLSKFQIMTICLGLVGTFIAITGSSPPIVRAGVICVLSLWAWYYGRNIKPFVLLLVGGVITVFANPTYLWGNVSWYLSFLSFFGVLILAPLITRRILGSREPKILTGILIETICATVMVLPYALYVFGQLSSVSIIANLLVVPFIPIAMLFSLIAGCAGILIPMFVGWFAFPAVWVLTYMLDIASVLSKLPHSYIENIGFSQRATVVCYATILVVLSVLYHKVRKNDSGKNLKFGSHHAYDPPKPPPES